MRTAGYEQARGDSRWTKKSTRGEPRVLRKPGNNLLSRISTIIGGACLTTVFGMGTGMARHLWSPGIRGRPAEPLTGQREGGLRRVSSL